MLDEKADFTTKLTQIEEHANLAQAELSPGLTRNRLQHISVLAKYLRARLDLVASSLLGASPGGSKTKPPA
jgi:hypothetical protein